VSLISAAAIAYFVFTNYAAIARPAFAGYLDMKSFLAHCLFNTSAR